MIGFVDPVELLSRHTAPFLLVLVRVSAIFVFAPVFSTPEIPFQARGILSAALALVIYPFAYPHLPSAPDWASFLLLLADGALVGLVLGLVVLLYHSVFLMAGQFYSLQMGFGIVHVVDPLSQETVPILGQAKSMFALLLFLALGGHHVLIEALARSFALVPSLSLADAGPLYRETLLGIGRIFDLGLRIAAPIVGTIFLVELVLGILSRAAPQMNVLVIGFQVKIVTGLVVLMLLWPVILQAGQRVYELAFSRMGELLMQLAAAGASGAAGRASVGAGGG